MPCYLFTYHGFGTWMPDHPRGYVHRGVGILPTDKPMAAEYRRKIQSTSVRFDSTIQSQLVDGTLEACLFQHVRCHSIATETTHVHILASWKTERTWQIVRRQIRGNLTRRLNRAFERRDWFSKSGSRKRVKDRRHFDHLMKVYLPQHSGLKYSELEGLEGREGLQTGDA